MSLVEEISGAMTTQSGRDVNRSSLTLAKVTNIKDDKNLNRVKCLPIGAQNEAETDWCYVMAPMGGKEAGMCFFPQVNDLVVLAYLGDDPHRPIVLGAFWNSEVPPPYPIQDGKVQDYGVRTPKKIEVHLHDEDKKQRVTLTMPSGTVIDVDDDAQKIEIRDKAGDNALQMDLKGGNTALKCKKELVLSAGKTTITLESGGNITIEGNGAVKLEGASIAGKAKGSVSFNGGSAEMKSNGPLDLQGAGVTTLRGMQVNIN